MNTNLQIAKEAHKIKMSTLNDENVKMLQSISDLGFFKLSEKGGKTLSLGNIKTLIEQHDENKETYKPSRYGTYKQRAESGRQVKKGAFGCWLAIPMFGSKEEEKEDDPVRYTFRPFFLQSIKRNR